MLRPTRSSAAYRYPLRRTGFWQHYLLDYDAYDTVGNTQKSTLSGAFCMFVPAHSLSFASMASQTSSMSPTMP